MLLFYLAKLVPLQDRISPAKPNLLLKRPILRYVLVPVKEVTTNKSEEKAGSLKQSIMQLLCVVAKAKQNPSQFEKQHLTAIEADVYALDQTGYSQHTK